MSMMEGALIPVSDFPTNNENVDQENRMGSILTTNLSRRQSS
jgi:hypothetical protein